MRDGRTAMHASADEGDLRWPKNHDDQYLDPAPPDGPHTMEQAREKIYM